MCVCTLFPFFFFFHPKQAEINTEPNCWKSPVVSSSSLNAGAPNNDYPDLYFWKALSVLIVFQNKNFLEFSFCIFASTIHKFCFPTLVKSVVKQNFPVCNFFSRNFLQLAIACSKFLWTPMLLFMLGLTLKKIFSGIFFFFCLFYLNPSSTFIVIFFPVFFSWFTSHVFSFFKCMLLIEIIFF